MEQLNRIDFEYIIYADKCNPNGDPCDGNTPRENFDGHGEISDVCIKRKIRDRLYEAGEEILVMPTDVTGQSLLTRIKESDILSYAKKNSLLQDELNKMACEKWFDVRAFGMILPFKSNGAVSTHLQGCVSIGMPSTVNPLETHLIQMVSGQNNISEEKKESNTMGMKYVVDKALYVGTGSIYPSLAEKNGFTVDDAEKIKQAILNIFENDASASRPAGSMTLCELHWWTHDCKSGRYPQIKVFNSITIEQIEEYPFYKVIENYELDNVKHEVFTNV